MTVSLRRPAPILSPFLVCFALSLCSGAAYAQSVTPDETAGPSGVLAPRLELTPVQRSTIYTAVMRQHTGETTAGIASAIGAPVPPSAALQDLPAQAGLGDDPAAFLKYAMVEDDVVVVDPIRMRVVDVIHPGARP